MILGDRPLSRWHPTTRGRSRLFSPSGVWEIGWLATAGRSEVQWARTAEQGDEMRTIALDAEVGQISAELLRRGLPSAVRVHAVVEVPAEEDAPTVLVVEAGGVLDWLAEEPDLYTDDDLIERVR
jgi:hypothetical protein